MILKAFGQFVLQRNLDSVFLVVIYILAVVLFASCSSTTRLRDKHVDILVALDYY